MKIKTWTERCDDHSDHQTGMISHSMIQARMQEEIEDLRAEVERLREALRWYADHRNHFPVLHHRRAGDPDPVSVFVEEPPIMTDGGRRAREALEGKQ